MFFDPQDLLLKEKITLYNNIAESGDCSGRLLAELVSSQKVGVAIQTSEVLRYLDWKTSVAPSTMCSRTQIAKPRRSCLRIIEMIRCEVHYGS